MVADNNGRVAEIEKQFQHAIEEFNSINEAILDCIARGDRPGKIKETHCGDFDDIRTNLNAPSLRWESDRSGRRDP